MSVDDPNAMEEAMDRVLAARPEASALACVDAASGFVIASAARSEEAHDAVVARGDPRWVQVHAPVPGRSSVYVVGVARADEEVARLASCVRDVSALLGAAG